MATTYNYILTVSDGNPTNDLTISSRGEFIDYLIKSLDFEKHLYSPCSVNIEISVSPNKKISDITKDFSSKSAKLEFIRVVREDTPAPGNEEEKETGVTITRCTICENYIIYRFKPVKVGSTTTVYLNLFSRDKLLTLDKFNKVYLNKQLGNGIIKGMLGEDGPLKNLAVDFEDAKNLQFMQYTLKGKTAEVIQPYRVQYNEDFYSFISRVSCQCGEILYFEDGKLRLGLKPDAAKKYDSTLKDDDFTRIEYPTYEQSAIDEDKTGVYYRNYVRDLHDGDSDYIKAFNSEVTVKDLPFTDSGAFDEYFDILDRSDGQLPDQSEFYWPDFLFLALKYVPSFITKQYLTIIEKVVKCGKDIAALLVSYKYSKDDVNDKFKEAVFDDKEKNTDSFISEQQFDNEDKISQFADLVKDGFGPLLHDRLSEIRSNEIKSAKERIIIQLKTSSYIDKGIKLGSSVSYDSKGYIVTSCTGRYSSEGGITTEIEIVPFEKDESGKLVFYPPYDNCAVPLSVSPQTAVVSANSDPRYQGRVRIRYPWQKSDEKGSPWVRVLTPLASKSGSMHFQPKEGDEVMVGYIDGNIERPYVTGSLFNKDAVLHDSLYSSYDNTIRVGSQRLDFRKGTLTAFVSSFVPFVGTLGEFNPPAAANWANAIVPREDVFESLGFQGLTRLTDVNGLWVIEGNTTTRSITIKSGLGKITMNAYTGIDIETTGDISIKGKNISISAQNNITIESGTAIKDDRAYESKSATEVLKDMAEGEIKDILVGSIDLSLFRTLWESFVLPKEGTLKIKSNRYLLLEAGRGVASDNEFAKNKDGEYLGNKEFVPASKASVNALIVDTEMKKAAVEINRIHAAVNDYVNGVERAKETLTKLKTSFRAKFTDDTLEEYELSFNFENLKNTLKDITIEQLKGDDGPQYEKFKDKIEALKERLKDPILRTEPNLENMRNHQKYFLMWKSFHIGFKNGFNQFDAAIDAKKTGKPEFDDEIKLEYDTYRGTVPQIKKKIFHNICSMFIETAPYLKSKGSDDWNKVVDSVEVVLPEKSMFDKLKNAASEIIQPYIETFSPSKEYAFSKNRSEGRIIMSQNEEESIIFTNGHTLGHTYNDSIKIVKDALRKGFTE